MTGRRSTRRGRGKATTSSQDVIPQVYQDMLAEATHTQPDLPQRPLKKRRTARNQLTSAVNESAGHAGDQNYADDDEDIEFEDVLDAPKNNETVGSDLDSTDEATHFSPKPQQTVYRDSSEESSEHDFDWENLDFDANPPQDTPATGDLELTLTKPPTSQTKTAPVRRKAVTRSERALRLQIHKTHLLCLLVHIDRRNDWCNDLEVQKSLKPLLDKKMLTFLVPRSDLSQFGRAESLKRGLEMVSSMWKARYRITARGMRRSLWAEEEEDIPNFRLPPDSEAPMEKADFQAAAKSLKGSRDLGVQFYCALLRSAGLDVRLACSIQALSFTTGGPPMPKALAPLLKSETPESSDENEAIDIRGLNSPFVGNSGSGSTSLPMAARQRLGHPNAADYYMPHISPPSRPPARHKRAIIHESAYPIYWVEVLDEAHQKWIPVDPLVTETIAKPRVFEPPASDRENNMSYVMVFNDEGSARDVTRRYVKAYNAKTRKTRVESTEGGERWLKKVMNHFSRGWTNDQEQIEDTELAAAEAREPMPKNVADFKDHPYYALERHLRRHEVLVNNREVGKVAAGRDPGTPGRKKLESIYRRRDVKVAKSADAWYRLGREIKMGEQPVKIVTARRNKETGSMEDDLEEQPGTNLYTEDQTELYEAPPVINGRVPKNSYGNLDIFVPTMVPKGGVHLIHPGASRAARLLGISYADALTGFEFRGRHGTAILKGAVVAAEYREAVEAVIEGFQDSEAQAREEMRTLSVLRIWKRFLIGLRIKERVDGYEVEGEDPSPGEAEDQEIAEQNDSGMETEEYDYDDEGGGGFIPE